MGNTQDKVISNIIETITPQERKEAERLAKLNPQVIRLAYKLLRRCDCGRILQPHRGQLMCIKCWKKYGSE